MGSVIFSIHPVPPTQADRPRRPPPPFPSPLPVFPHRVRFCVPSFRRALRAAWLPGLLATAILVSGLRAIIPSAPPGQLESGVPPFSVLGRESLGLAALPTDLHQLPDGRLLVVTPQQVAVGDGIRWEVFNRKPGDNGAPLDGVAVSAEGRIYAGMRNGFGEVTFTPDGTWELRQVATWPAELHDRTPIPRFCIDVDGDWFWHSESGNVIRWRPGEPATLFGRASTVETIFKFRDDYYLSDRVIGQLFRMGPAAQGTPLFGGLRLTADDAISCTVPFGDQLLVGTYAKGLFLFDGEKTTPFGGSGILSTDGGYVDLHTTAENHFVAAIDGFGIVYFDEKGQVLDVFDRTRDPRVTRVRRLVPTADGVLWALLGDGIARLELPAPLTTFESLLPAGADFVSVQRHDGELWIISNGTIMRGNYTPSGRLLDFAEVPIDRGFAFSLSTATGEVLAGTDRGVFAHRPDGWERVSAETINFRLLAGPPRNGRWLYAATEELGWVGHAADGSLQFERHTVPGFIGVFDSCADPRGVVWLEMGSGLLGRLEALPDGTFDLQQLGAAQGVPEGWVQAYVIDDRAAFNVGDRLFRFNEQTRQLEPAYEHLRQFAGFRHAIGRPVRDAYGRVWVAGDDRIHVFDTTTDPWTDLEFDLPGGLRPYFFTPEENGVMWLHGDRRLARFDPWLKRARHRPQEAIITRLSFPVSNRTLFEIGDQIDALDYADNSLTVYFAAPNAELRPPTTFEVRLGEQEEWESQGTAGSATFNRLPEGSYRLQVRARTGEHLTEPDSVSFRVNPPWYRSNLAYLGYGLGALALIGLAVWFSTLLERRENQRLENLVKQRTGELKEINEQLEEQVEEIRILSQAINQSPVSVLITQTDGTILFANPQACALSGYRESELVGQPAAMLRVPESRDEHQAEIESSLAAGNIWTGELTNRHADGHNVHVRATISPIRNADNTLRFHLILEEDITAWLAERERHRRLEDQLFQARKLESIGTLAGGIAHDFNNILTGILGHCEIALLDIDPQTPLAADLKDIRKSGLRAKDLVSQILTFSRKADSKLAPTDISRPVSEALKLVRASTPSYIEIAQNLSPGVVMADATQIHQIVLNLCTNAVHAIDEKSGRISVELKPIEVEPDLCAEIPDLRPGSHMVLVVTDNGTGMDAATLERIFDPFFTTKEQGKGTGLGLSTVQGIMASHRGAHRVRSQRHVGTTFELYFPTCSESAPVRPMIRELIEEGAAREVLVVDDETTVVQFVSTRLRQFGYLPQVFGDPRQALQAFLNDPHRYEALITDLTMPHLTGADLIQRIRDTGSTIPAIVITGYGRENALEKLHTLSNTYVLGKPFSGEELARLLGRALRSAARVHP